MLWCVHLNILNLFTVCWFLYLVRTADNALYTGITTDVARRFLQHQTVGDRSLALRLEYRIKQLTKRQKERLVNGDGSFEALRESLLKND